MNYGLIGKTLKHSHSKAIHETLQDEAYTLFELREDELRLFLENRSFVGVNVTIPYKETILPFLDEIDEEAKEIGSVNTVVNRNNKLKGYNTDCRGLEYLLRYHNVCAKDAKVLILGSGGTSKTAQYVLKKLGAKEIIVVSRNPKNDMISYDQAKLHNDADILINTTPLGMFPAVEESPIDLSIFKQCLVAIDVIYNPLKTTYLRQAEKLGIKAVGGLSMLVAQAVYASELFHDCQYDPSTIYKIWNSLHRKLLNLVLIGMPGSGKTTIGERLAEKTNKKFVDLDKYIEEEAGENIPSIFKTKGEAYFRDLEATSIRKCALQQAQVIACGGGAIIREENIQYLKANGLLFYIEKNVENLAISDDRPLSRGLEDNQRLFAIRKPLYEAYADKIFANDATIEHIVTKIKEYYDEISCD